MLGIPSEATDNDPNSTQEVKIGEAVMQTIERIGAFNWEPAPPNDGIIVEFKNKVPVGLGATYTGEWSLEGLRHGRGTQIMNNGALYEGYWIHDQACGRGRLIHFEGEYYLGELMDDKAHGFGKFELTDGSYYEGNWTDDKRHGEGTETWANKSVFKGTFKRGEKHGLG